MQKNLKDELLAALCKAEGNCYWQRVNDIRNYQMAII